MTKWIIPCNLKNYNVVGAFSELTSINWSQKNNFQVNDLVYIYVSGKAKAIKYLCVVTATELPAREIDDKKFWKDSTAYADHGRYMRLELLAECQGEAFTLANLKAHGLRGNLQSAVILRDELERFIQDEAVLRAPGKAKAV